MLVALSIISRTIPILIHIKYFMYIIYICILHIRIIRHQPKEVWQMSSSTSHALTIIMLGCCGCRNYDYSKYIYRVYYYYNYNDYYLYICIVWRSRRKAIITQKCLKMEINDYDYYYYRCSSTFFVIICSEYSFLMR